MSPATMLLLHLGCHLAVFGLGCAGVVDADHKADGFRLLVNLVQCVIGASGVALSGIWLAV